MHACFDGVTRDQMMARHKSNHIQVVYAPDEKKAHRACRIKAAMMAELGLEVHFCGNSPCVEVNGRMLADISGEEVEAFLLANSLVQTNDRKPDAPTNQPCAHEMPQSSPLHFR
jgi:hypothetical protein